MRKEEDYFYKYSRIYVFT